MERKEFTSPVKSRLKKHQLIPVWWITLPAIFLVLILFLILIFPEQFFKEQLSGDTASHTSLAYLRQLNALSEENHRLKLQIISEHLQLGEWKEAKEQLKIYQYVPKENPLFNEIQWLNYQVVHKHFYSKESKRPSKATYSKALGKALLTSQKPKQLIILANNAIALDEPKLAADAYKKLFALHPNQPLNTYIQAAKTALGAGEYELSGNYFFTAQQRAKSKLIKQSAFFQGVSAIEAGQNTKEALDTAIKHSQGLPETRRFLLFMAKLALRANQVQISEKYILRALYQPTGNAP